MDIQATAGLCGFILACMAAASSGAVFKAGDWYEGLAKPRWRPPNRAFPIAWAILYGCIAVAGWLVWRRAGFDGAGPAMTAYAIQLVFNAAWSAVFFGLHRTLWAFFELVLLWLSILVTILLFAPVSAAAAALLLPYLVWVTFAGALNFSIWQLNRVPV